MCSPIEKLANAIRQRGDVVVFSGAGISTESGVPDFRGPDGMWRAVRPVTFQEFLASTQGRAAYWAYKIPLAKSMTGVKPNAAHKAVAELFHRGKVRLVVTQNIDGLHQAAGLPEDELVELHGNGLRTGCLDCDFDQDTLAVIEDMQQQGREFPLCPECGGDKLKPRTVSFGQNLNEEAIMRAQRAAESCGILLVIGSSLTVSPANHLPILAKQAGALVAIINRGETQMDNLADIRIDGLAGEVLTDVVGRLDK